MNSLALFVVMAIIIEQITGVVKSFYKKDEGIQIPVIISVVIAVAITVSTHLDLISTLGFTVTVPFVGEILTGILFSKGANVFSDILNKIQGVNEPKGKE